MARLYKIKCKNCGFEDHYLIGEDDLPYDQTKTVFYSKKTGYIVRMKLKDTKKYADKKFCALDIENKDKYEWTRDFKTSDLRCPKCHKKDFESFDVGQT